MSGSIVRAVDILRACLSLGPVAIREEGRGCGQSQGHWGGS
jgi:hypothetical protein